MWGISDVKFGIPFYILFLIISVRYFGWKKGLLIILMGIISVAFADLSAKHLFKEVFQRYRPSHNLILSKELHFVYNYKGGLYGFVSSHSANMYAIASTLGFFFYKKSVIYMCFLIIWAGIIAYSRVYLGVHYPSDILVGGVLGFLIGYIVYYYSNKYIVTLK